MAVNKYLSFEDLRWDELSENCRVSLLEILKESLNRHCHWTKGCGNGYPTVSLCYPKEKPKSIQLHRFLILYTRGSIPYDMVVDHIDRDPLNFALCNLRVVSNRMNCQNKDKDKAHKAALKASKSRDLEKLREAQKKKRAFKQEVYLEIIGKHYEGIGYDKLAELYGISKAGIAYIIRNKENYL